MCIRDRFYRALLIVATPIIVLQITISVVFFDSLWIKTNKGMTNALIGEIKFFLDAYDNENYNKDNLINLFDKTENGDRIAPSSNYYGELEC